MTLIDSLLQNWRLRKAIPFIDSGMKVLDLGSADGRLFLRHGQCGAGSLGIDPVLPANQTTPDGFRLCRGFFPQDMPSDSGRFDAVVMLAVLEHFPDSNHGSLAEGVARYLRPGGRLIITVPAPFVDKILAVLRGMRLIEGMSLEEHHGFEVEQTPKIFAHPQFRLVVHRRFQLGLNHLFVFERIEEGGVGQHRE